MATGIALSIIAMLAWGFGDFLIQKSTRKIGDWETLFIMSLVGSLILLPFSYDKIVSFINSPSQTILVYAIASLVLLAAAIIDFEALRKGKLAIVEPIWSFEIPVASVLAYMILGEKIGLYEIVLIVGLMIFLSMLAFREKRLSTKMLLEKGAFLALVGAILMGGANFFIGWGGRIVDPIFVNFVTDIFLIVATGIILIMRGRMQKTFTDFKSNMGLLLPMSISDEIAWVAYTFAMTTAPIAIATALSESYIIVAVLLGIAVNHERLRKHQKIGLVGSIIVAIALAIISTH